MVSVMIGLMTSSTFSLDLRVATDLAASLACFLKARIVAESFFGASPDCWRVNSACFAAESLAKRSFQAACAARPRSAVASHWLLIAAGTSKAPPGQP